MSNRVALLLEVDRVRVLSAPPSPRVVDVAWDPTAPADAMARIADACGAASSLVLVVGLGFLEIARPDLPPLAAPARRALLLRDADRYVPLEGDVAVAWCDGLAVAISAPVLERWVRAFEAVAPVDAVFALPQLAGRAQPAVNGTVTTDSAAGEHGVIVLAGGTVRDARRAAGAAPPNERGSALSVEAVLRVAAAQHDAPIDAQLLDRTVAARIETRRRGRVLRSAAIFVVALLMLGWSAARWRDRARVALQQQVNQLATQAATARAAAQRVERAAAEQRLLRQADSAAAVGSDAAAVLARLSALLPKDAFVQRLEWDGVTWRIDGSANDAPRIVPLLDADAHFADVRIVAASQRFLDAGKQRESFSIAFKTRTAPGGPRVGQ